VIDVETETANLKDVAEPDQTVSGAAGTGQENRNKKEISGKPEGTGFRLIRTRGEKVYRTSVIRTHYHYYNISIRTRSLLRELRGREKIPAPDCPNANSDSDCGGGIT
jgi:hypothetical protein